MSEVTEPIILDGTGQAIKDALLQIRDAVSGKGGVVYGFHINGDEGDPDSKVSYLRDAAGMTPAHMDFTAGKFRWGSWLDAFFLPRPCMVKQDGTVDYYLAPDNYALKEDGTASDVANAAYAGNAMMEWGQNGKKIWMKIVPDAGDVNSASVYIADHQEDADFHDWPFHNCDGVSVEHFYTPIYNGSVLDGTMRSLSGQQVGKSRTAEAEITAARANNKSDGIIWDTECFADITLINMLLILISKTVNTQAAFGEGLHTSGTEAINDAFRTGVHNDKGLFYGTNSGAAATYANAVKVFGMENWWGFQWRRYRGHIMVDGVQKVKLTAKTEDGSSAVGYNLTGEGYITLAGATPTGTSGHYADKMLFSEKGMVPKNADNTKATASTQWCDGLWFNNSGTRVPFRGGYSTNGVLDGAFSVALGDDASLAWWPLGAALSCKPLG